MIELGGLTGMVHVGEATKPGTRVLLKITVTRVETRPYLVPSIIPYLDRRNPRDMHISPLKMLFSYIEDARASEVKLAAAS